MWTARVMSVGELTLAPMLMVPTTDQLSRAPARPAGVCSRCLPAQSDPSIIHEIIVSSFHVGFASHRPHKLVGCNLDQTQGQASPLACQEGCRLHGCVPEAGAERGEKPAGSAQSWRALSGAIHPLLPMTAR